VSKQISSAVTMIWRLTQWVLTQANIWAPKEPKIIKELAILAQILWAISLKEIKQSQ